MSRCFRGRGCATPVWILFFITFADLPVAPPGSNGYPDNQGDMHMKKTVIATAQAPAAIGPYSQAVKAGDLLFISGQIGIDPATQEVVAGGVEAQARQVLRNIGAILAAAGLEYGNVVKTTIFLADMADFKAVNALYAEFFPAPFPARSTVAVRELPRSVAIEIETIAAG
jgi:2-iminobutanoate/2-iminopropanoate deaminase